jgi:hypothetical protein
MVVLLSVIAAAPENICSKITWRFLGVNPITSIVESGQRDIKSITFVVK